MPKKSTIEAITKYAMTMCSRSHDSGYASITIQIMHIKTMIANQARNISPPHGGANSASDRACTCTANRARRAGDEETTSATEASSSQNRAAADPPAEDYRPQPLKVGESRLQNTHARIHASGAGSGEQCK